MNSELVLLKEKLNNALPGYQAQKRMMPESRQQYNFSITKKTRISSILIGLFLKNNIYHTVLFQRPDYSGNHSGQVCFPGGKREDDDSGLIQTALRETYEEVGIHPDQVRMLGRLTTLHIPVSDYVVHPFIGYIIDEPVFTIDPKEVKELIIAPVDFFLQEENKKTEIMHLHHLDFNVPYYALGNYKIWGATAMIISEWEWVLRSVNFPRTGSYSADIAQ